MWPSKTNDKESIQHVCQKVKEFDYQTMLFDKKASCSCSTYIDTKQYLL